MFRNKLHIDNSSKDEILGKFFFLFLHWSRFLVILLTILYDKYIDRPILTEQKETSWIYWSSLPQVVSIQENNSYFLV